MVYFADRIWVTGQGWDFFLPVSPVLAQFTCMNSREPLVLEATSFVLTHDALGTMHSEVIAIFSDLFTSLRTQKA